MNGQKESGTWECEGREFQGEKAVAGKAPTLEQVDVCKE